MIKNDIILNVIGTIVNVILMGYDACTTAVAAITTDSRVTILVGQNESRISLITTNTISKGCFSNVIGLNDANKDFTHG